MKMLAFTVKFEYNASLKLLKINTTLAFYRRGYGSNRTRYDIEELRNYDQVNGFKLQDLECRFSAFFSNSYSKDLRTKKINLKKWMH